MTGPPSIRPRRAATLARAATTTLVAALLAACAPQPVTPIPPETAAPPGFPDAYYRNAARAGDAIFAIDPAASLVTIVVRRGGTLARLGHDHVVAIRDAHGLIDRTSERADVYARLDRMTVDEPALRRESQLDTQPTAADIAGTRTNMLERVLQVERHPFVEVAVRKPAATPAGPPPSATTAVRVSITLDGVTRTVPVEMATSSRGDTLEVRGTLAIDQTDFALRPMSLFGGAITVANRLDLRFDLRARRQPDAIERGGGRR